MEKKELLAETIAAQVQSLMDQADLTIEGLSEAAGLSTHTITKILKKQTVISSKTLEKLSTLFGVSPSQLLSSTKIQLKNIADSKALEEFHNSNEGNPNYFQTKAKDNVVAYFMKTILINDPYLNEGRVREIAEYIRTNPTYKKDFNPKVIAKVLDRMYKAGILDREDRTGKRSVYYYRRRTT